MKTIKDVFYSDGTNPAKVLDAYIPEGKAEAVFMYMHGGGLEKGDKSSSEIVGEYLAQKGIAFVSINYRMYPDAKYPDFIFDAAEAVAWVRKNMSELFGCDTLYVGGSSAGGYLSMMLCFDKKYLASVGLDNSVIAGYFHDAGQPTAHFKVLKNSGVDPRRIIVDETAPLYHVGLDEDYPRMRFIVSDNDMKNRYEQTMLMMSTLKHFEFEKYDHVVMHGKHCAYCKAVDENGESVLGKMILDFIQAK